MKAMAKSTLDRPDLYDPLAPLDLSSLIVRFYAISHSRCCSAPVSPPRLGTLRPNSSSWTCATLISADGVLIRLWWPAIPSCLYIAVTGRAAPGRVLRRFRSRVADATKL